MRKFFRGGGDFGGPVTEGGATQKKLGTTALDRCKSVEISNILYIGWCPWWYKIPSGE